MAEQKPKPLVLQWNQLTLDAIKFTRTSPPLAARALAMVHTAIYDAWSVYDEPTISTHTARYIKEKNAKQCTKENKLKAFSFAAYRVLMELFWLTLPPANRNIFSDFMCELGYDPKDTGFEISQPSGVGNLVGRLVIEDRAGDGSNGYGTLQLPCWADYTGYVPLNSWDTVKDLDHWQPLRSEPAPGEFKIQAFLVPHWGLSRPFGLVHPWQFRPAPPFKKHHSQFREQVKETLTISAGLTDRQKAIAEYWADGSGTYTPPGHWCEIAQFVADTCQYRTDDCVKLFFAFTNALLDASIACWECKRQYDSVRPVTAVRELYKGKDVQAWGGPHKGTQTIKGECWQPYIPTPPFPEHVSGHSTFSQAAATVLQCYTGSDNFGGCTVVGKGSSLIEKGTTPKQDITLEWATFTEAAEQAGMSRLYGGIHFSKANLDGQQLGKEVGKAAWERALSFFNDGQSQQTRSSA
jgi:hypothetical protein